MTEERDQGFLRWAPSGMLIAAVLAVGRTLGLLQAAERSIPGISPEQREILAWEHIASLPERLVQGLVLGLLAAAVTDGNLRRTKDVPGMVGALVLVLAILASGLTGWPLDPPALQATPRGVFAFDDVYSCVGFALVLELFLFGSLYGARRGHGYLVAGPVGLALGIAALAAPLWISLKRAADTPSFQVAEVVRELLGEELGQGLRLLSVPGGQRPSVGVISPDGHTRSDSGDKPALILPPGSRVSFRVSEEDGPVTLRAAAGVHQRLRLWLMEKGLDRAQVDFRVTVDGQERFAVGIPVSSGWIPDEYPAGGFRWHHVGGEAGLALEPGQEVVLETEVAEGDPAASAPPDFLMAGFGPLVLERSRSMERARARADAPNIVMVVMDTQRADRLSCYGHPRPTTPNLDLLAARGTLFEEAQSTASWTWPSTASLLTGLPADAHGVVSNASCTLSLGLESLPEALQRRGYTTGAISCNPLIAADRYFDQGFESFDDGQDFRMTDEVAGDAIRWLRAHRGVRFFLYLHLADPHTPHRPHPAEVQRLGFTPPLDFPDEATVGLDGMDHYTKVIRNDRTEATFEDLVPAAHRRWIDEQYDASVATGDRWLGILLDELEELGLSETTVVAFTSDHGEELFDHGELEHGHSLYQELTHVPLIMAGPGIPAGLRVQRPVSNRHLAPTLARIGGTELPDATTFGAEFLLEPELPEPGEAIFQTMKGDWGADRGQPLHGLREGAWVLHWRRRPQVSPGDLRLYNLDADPGEETSLLDTEQLLAEDMRRRLAERVEAQERWAPALRIGAGDNTTDMLQGIGYLPGEEEEAQSRGESDSRERAGSEEERQR